MTVHSGGYLALDTSCYTTSLAVVSGGKVVHDSRIMLEVPTGGRGLRQSEAVFAHVRNLKQLFLDYSKNGYTIRAIAYSEKPCPKQDSYMPVFTVGESTAVALASTLHVPTYPLTHQHGHIYAAHFGNDITDGQYCAMHVSGGTLELLRVIIQSGVVVGIETIGGTRDITCGQLIDRVGVAAGLPFPSGVAMERAYRPGGAKLSVNVDGLHTNLSGAETQALRMLEEGRDKTQVFSGVIDCVAQTLKKLTENAEKQTDLQKFIFTGGVICNTIVREQIARSCAAQNAAAIFAQKQYCSDNACGLALAAQINHIKEK